MNKITYILLLITISTQAQQYYCTGDNDQLVMAEWDIQNFRARYESNYKIDTTGGCCRVWDVTDFDTVNDLLVMVCHQIDIDSVVNNYNLLTCSTTRPAITNNVNKTIDRRHFIPVNVKDSSIMVRRLSDGKPVVNKYGSPLALNEVLQLDDFNSMPETGEWIDRGSCYVFEGELFQVIQSHNVTIYHPSIVPALFKQLATGVECQPHNIHVGWDEGACVTDENGVKYISTIPANTTPLSLNDEDSPWTYWDKEPFNNY